MSARRARPILKRVFVDEMEEQLIRENMSRFGTMKFSTYARRVLLFPNTPIIQVDLSSHEKVLYEMRRIGNNINQLAKVAHQSKEVDPKMVQELKSWVESLAEHLQNEMPIKIQEIRSQYGSYKA